MAQVNINGGWYQTVAVELPLITSAMSRSFLELLDQIEGSVGSMTGIGADDGKAAYHAVAERYPSVDVIIPLDRRRFRTEPR